MSGRETVQNLRERGFRPARPDRGPVLRMLGLVVAAFVLGGGAVYGGVKFFAPGAATAPGLAETVIPASETPFLTKEDEAACGRAFDHALAAEREASRQAMDSGAAIYSTGSGSIGPLGAELICLARTKPRRLCNSEQRATFVAHVKGYLEKSMFVQALSEATDLSMDVYMPLIPGASGNAGIDVVKDMTRGVNERLAKSHRRVAGAIRDLVSAGYLREEDFSAFMGFGVPPQVRQMLKGVTPGPSVCF